MFGEEKKNGPAVRRPLAVIFFIIFACFICCAAFLRARPSAKAAGGLKGASAQQGIFDGKTYTHSDAFDGFNIYNGIDVSYYNKDIDWDSVKEGGVEFAIIRVGYRGYGSTGALCTDTKFVENIEGALAAGIEVGVYYFTEAVNEEEAVEEAEYCLEKIRPYNVTLPVVIDYEYPSNSSGHTGRMYKAKLSKSEATNNCIAFCDTVREAGYEPMIYANKTDLTSLINGKKLAKDYKIWLANYTTRTTYENPYSYWQYTSSGSVDGISGKVDCNFRYEPSGASVLPTEAPDVTEEPVAKTDISSAVVEAIPNQTYTGRAIKPKTEVKVDGKTLVEGKDYKVSYLDNADAGKAAVQIVGTGSYEGSVKAEFLIMPKAPDSFTCKTYDKKIILVWSQGNGADGYEIGRKDAYDGAYKKIKAAVKGTAASYNDANLLSGREYYYRIRSFKNIDGKTYYSGYATLAASAMKSRRAAVAGEKIKLLKKPASGSGRLAAIHKDATMQYVGKVHLKNKTSYLHMVYSLKSKTYDGYAAADAKLKYYSMGVTTTSLNMRKAAGVNKKLIAVVPSNTAVAILKKVKVKSKIWYKTKYYNGKKAYTGYVSSDYVK